MDAVGNQQSLELGPVTAHSHLAWGLRQMAFCRFKGMNVIRMTAVSFRESLFGRLTSTWGRLSRGCCQHRRGSGMRAGTATLAARGGSAERRDPDWGGP